MKFLKLKKKVSSLKYLGLILPLLMTLPNSACAALQADTAFEVRTTGDDSNGACYDVGGTGTDYSQQDSAQLSLTDVATSGTGVTTLTSSTGGFTSAMVDNCIHISSGTNAVEGFYEITGYTDTNTVTLDRAPDDGVGGVSGGYGKVGGALANPIMIQSSLGVEQYNTIWIESGTYSLKSGESYIMSLDKDNLFVRGYGSSRWDYPTGTNRPYFNSSGATYGIYINSGPRIIENIRISNATSHGIFQDKYKVRVPLFNIHSYSNGGSGVYADASDIFNIWFSEFNNNTGSGVASNYGIGALYGVYTHDNTQNGTYGNNANYDATIRYSIADSNGSGGFYNRGDKKMFNCISYNNSGNGFGGDQYTRYNSYINCSAVSNGGYGFHAISGGQTVIFNNNHTHNNTSGAYSNITGGVDDITGDPSFTNAASGNFEVSSSSILIDAGISMTDYMSSLGGTLNFNIGIDQKNHTSAGSTPVTTSFGYAQ